MVREVFDSILVICVLSPEGRFLIIRERSNVHEIVGDDRKVMCLSAVDVNLPRQWDGWMLGSMC